MILSAVCDSNIAEKHSLEGAQFVILGHCCVNFQIKRKRLSALKTLKLFGDIQIVRATESRMWELEWKTIRTLVDKEYKNGQGIRKFLQDPSRWNACSVHEPCRNFRIPCSFLYSQKRKCKVSYCIAERTRNYTDLQGIRTQSARFCIPCQLGRSQNVLTYMYKEKPLKNQRNRKNTRIM